MYRHAAGMTHVKLAERLQCSRNYIAMIECGRRLPSVSLLVELADEFGVTPNHLLGYDVSAEASTDYHMHRC